ncbi:MAG: enoyl-CoA hydratase [Hyphomonadaceae bacterium]
MSEEALLIARPRDGLAVLTMNRPARRNALSAALRRALVAAFADLAGEGVRVVILTGAGDAFCAGLDLNELREDTAILRSLDAENPVAAAAAFPGAVIGAINGPAMTGGFELALACDVLIASEKAVFADTHLRVGVMPGWGLSQRLSRVVGIYRAKQLSFSGASLPARQAAAWGLVGEVTAAEDLLPTALALGERMLAAPGGALRMMKRMIDEGYALSFSEGMALEARLGGPHNAAVTPEAVGARRDGVLERGRADAGGGKEAR